MLIREVGMRKMLGVAQSPNRRLLPPRLSIERLKSAVRSKRRRPGEVFAVHFRHVLKDSVKSLQ